MMKWTKEDQDAALSQGWGLFSMKGMLEIQTWGEDPTDRFTTDETAREFVFKTAEGSVPNKVARKALEVLAAEWMEMQFVDENCYECGRGEEGHVAVLIGLGDYGANFFAVCKGK